MLTNFSAITSTLQECRHLRDVSGVIRANLSATGVRMLPGPTLMGLGRPSSRSRGIPSGPVQICLGRSRALGLRSSATVVAAMDSPARSIHPQMELVD